MAKYHIKKDGMPGVCRAQNGNCPYGNESEHFPTKEQAQEYADKRNESIDKRNKLAVQFIKNRSLEIERTLYSIYENVEKGNDFNSNVQVALDSGQILIRKTISVDVASNPYEKVNKSTHINIRIDPDNPSKMNVKVEREDSTWKNAVSTPLGGLRHMDKKETEILQKVESKLKNKVSRNKEQVLEACFESDNFVFNDLDQYKGKSVSDTIDGLDSERYYVIKDRDNSISMTAKDGQGTIGVNGKDGKSTTIAGDTITIKDKDNNELAEGRKSYDEFDKSLLSKPINNIEVKAPGSEEEMIYLYI